MDFIKLYMGGVEVSQGDGSYPVTTRRLDSIAEDISPLIQLSVRCATGYEAASVVLSFVGGTPAFWRFVTNDGLTPSDYLEWGEPLTLTGVTDSDTFFNVQCMAPQGDTPAVDESVDIGLYAVVEAASA